MRIRVSCPACDQRFSVAAEYEGRRVKCPSCSEPVRVVDHDEHEEPEDRPRRRSSERSSRKQAKTPQSSGTAVAIGLGLAGGIVALGVLIFLLSRPPAAEPAAQPNPAPPPTAASVAAATPTAAPGPAVATSSASNVSPAPVSSVSPTSPAIAAAPPRPNPPEPQPALREQVTGKPTSEPAAPAVEAADTAGLKLQGVPIPSATKLELPELIQRVEPAVVRINVVSSHGASTGSGFVVSTDGTVVTNYHVMTDALRAEIEFENGTTGKVLGYRHLAPESDIAILKIDVSSDRLTPVPLSTQLPLKGESVATFGAPLGLSFTTSEGTISAIRKETEIGSELGLKVRGTWLQTTAPISPGNSGGPLVDKFGKVVGMNTLQSSVGQNLNFAVSSLEIIKALDAVKDAPQKITPLEPSKLPPREMHERPDLASDEIETERGRRLFAEVKEIVLINATHNSNFDPSGEIWNRVITRSQRAVEKTGISLSYGNPRPDVAVMVVFLEMNLSKKGTGGTQELSVTAELACVDPLAKKNQSRVAKVWKSQKSLGTISLSAAAQGQIPRGVDEKLTDFFGGFRTAYNKAVKASKEAKNPGDKSS